MKVTNPVIVEVLHIVVGLPLLHGDDDRTVGQSFGQASDMGQ